MNKTGNSAGMKAPYSRPKIAIYGEFANLTAGGMGSRIEGMMSPNALMKQMA